MLRIETNYRITESDFEDVVVAQSQTDDDSMLFVISQNGSDIELSLEMMDDLSRVLEKLKPTKPEASITYPTGKR